MPDATTQDQADTRLIVALIGAATGFALIGHEIQVVSGAPAKQGNVQTASTVLSSGGRIIVGGFAAAAVLALLSHAGDAGRQFAVGLAVITGVTSMLVYGGPVWAALARAVGGAPGAHPTGATTPTGTTTPAQGAVLIAEQAA